MAVVDVLPFPDSGMPLVVTWGIRTFVTNPSFQTEGVRWVYKECFAVASLTASPGRTAVPPEPPPPPPPVDHSAVTTLHGTPIGEHREIGPDGMQKDYIVLTEEERRKGFVRPVRRSYLHVGVRPKYPTRDLTDEEKTRFAKDAYVKYEEFPPECRPSLGEFWTERRLNSGCGEKTTMGQALAETYAREPTFYSGTFCATCRQHFPVGAAGEFVWLDNPDQRVGT